MSAALSPRWGRIVRSSSIACRSGRRTCSKRAGKTRQSSARPRPSPLPLRRGWIGRWIGSSLVHPQSTLCTADRVKAWHTAGMPINAWTVDDRNELERLAALGIDGVFANDPAHAIAVLSAVS